MARSKRDIEYDERVFELEEDPVKERRKQFVQYILVAACAVAVIGLALYASIELTNRRMKDPQAVTRITPDTPSIITNPEAEARNYWPADEFANVPVFEAVEYETRSENGRAVIEVPQSASEGFASYADQLLEAGAKLWVDQRSLKVFELGSTEIHLVAGNARSQIVLCNEPSYNWNDNLYSAFKKPDAGRLVKVELGSGADSRVLTYRGVNAVEALSYTQELGNSDWQLTGNLEPDRNTFQAVYKKGNLQETVDYFSSGDDFKIKLDFLN